MKYSVPILSVVAWVVIIAMSYLNPSGTIPMDSIRRNPGFFLVGTSVLAFVLPLLAMQARNFGHFLLRWGVGFLLLLALSWYAAIHWHRDFLVFEAQLIMMYLIIFILTIDSFHVIRKKHQVYRFIFLGALVIFSLWTLWLMLMSYTIVTREEPRWIEATAYNVVNGIIGIAFLVSAILLRERSNRVVHMVDGVLYLDDRSITAFLSPQENRIVSAFLLEPTHHQTCSSLLSLLKGIGKNGHDNGLPPLEGAGDCEHCMDERWTASACPVYRNLKNRIADSKKYLELLQIGTIVPVSENPRDIKEKGWRLRFFDDIKCHSS